MELSFKLDAFEGPLDLLLHLIEKNKVSIYDIPIALITDQYMEYMSQLDTIPMDAASEFMVMAATLLEIKARMLLPKEEEEEEEEGDPREELMQQLLQHKMFKEMGGELRAASDQTGMRYYRSQDLPAEVRRYQPPVDLTQLLDGVTLQKLKETFDLVMQRAEDKIDPLRSGFGKIQKEPVRVSDKIGQLVRMSRKEKKFSFRSMLENQHSRFEIVVTFLAVLEMLKVGWLTLSQEEPFGDIEIEANLPQDPKELDQMELEFA